MAGYFARASYRTRSGNPRYWTGPVDAPDIEAALSKAMTSIARRHRGASKIDIHLTATPLVDIRAPSRREKGEAE
ncbi:hypothetical protein Sbs19_20150 [Sphingobium sp. BS19]|nr:hypothetical protein Sbs19_20150 [Sphingobium sp. BS19]